MRNTPERNARFARRLVLGTAAVTLAASLLQPAIAQPMGGPRGFAGDHAEMGGMMGGPGRAGHPGGMMGMGDMAGMGPGGGGMGMMGGRGGERMLDAIGASAEQKTQLRQIMDNARNDLKPVREAGRALHRQLMALFAQPTVDARAVESLRQQLQTNHEQASKRMLQAMLDASRVLTPEQRKQMSDRMEQQRSLMQRHRAEREALEGAPRRP